MGQTPLITEDPPNQAQFQLETSDFLFQFVPAECPEPPVQ
jgi:hypothetical protein